MVRWAVRDCRAQLGRIDEGGSLYGRILDIFLLFCGKLGEEDEGADAEDLS